MAPFLILPAGEDVYAAGYCDGTDAKPAALVRIPREIVERAVLQANGVQLELRPDGSIAVFAAAMSDSTLCQSSISALVAEALDPPLLRSVDDADDLAQLETELEQALIAVRGARARLLKP